MVRRGKDGKSRNEVEEMSRVRKAGREGIGRKGRNRGETREGKGGER